MDFRKIKNTILFLTKIKIENYFDNNWKYLKILLLIIGLIVMGFYLYLSDFLLEAEYNSQIENTNILFLLNVIPIIFISSANMFPTLKLKPNIFPNYYPLKNSLKITLNICYAFLNSFNVLFFMFFFILFIINDHYHFLNLIISYEILFYSFLANYSLRNLLENNFSGTKIGNMIYVILFYILLIIICLSMYLSLLSNIILLLIFVLLNILILFFNYKKEQNTLSKKNKKYYSYKTFNNFYYTIILNHKPIRSSLLTGYIYKIIVLSLITLMLKLKNIMFLPPIFYWLFLSPIILYSYFLNNFFGFKRELFLVVELSIKKRIVLIKMFLGFLLICTLIDAIVFLIFIIVNNQLTTNNILFYFICFIPLSISGIIVSLLQAKSLGNSSSFKISNKNVPIIGNVLSAFSIILLFFLKSSIIFQLLFLSFFIVLAIYMNHMFSKIYSNRKYLLYKKLFSSS